MCNSLNIFDEIKLIFVVKNVHKQKISSLVQKSSFGICGKNLMRYSINAKCIKKNPPLKIFNLVNMCIWCYLYATWLFMSKTSSQRHGWAFSPWNSTGPIRVSQTRIQAATVSQITSLKNQSCQPAGWGYGGARAIRGEARCSYVSVFCKLTFTVFKWWWRRVLLLVSKLQQEKWRAVI